MSEFEVVRSEVDGWDVRRVGEAQALSNHATREEATKAAELQGGDGDAVDVRQNVFSESPEEDLDAKKTLLGVGTVLIAVIVLIIVVAVIVSVTGIGN